MQQTILFGVADPLWHIPDEGTRSLLYNQIEGLCAMCALHHINLVWVQDGHTVELPPHEAVVPEPDILGIVIQTTDDTSLDALLDLRQMRGLAQALVDWEVVRLAASMLRMDVDNGRLFVVNQGGA
ncbi:MAG: hypothetical protein WCG26_13775 [Chloroflexales bacterium]